MRVTKGDLHVGSTTVFTNVRARRGLFPLQKMNILCRRYGNEGEDERCVPRDLCKYITHQSHSNMALGQLASTHQIVELAKYITPLLSPWYLE